MNALKLQNIKRFFWPPVEDDDYLETASKRALIVFSVAAMFISCLTLMRYVSGQFGDVPTYTMLTLYSAPVFAVFPFLVHKGIPIRKIGIGFCVYTTIRLSILAFSLGGIDSSQTLFLIPLVLIGTFVLGAKEGMIGAGAALLIYAGLFFTVDKSVLSPEDYARLKAHAIQLSVILMMVIGAGAIFRREMVGALENLELARIQAESSNLAKSEFLANMSHEIRTPMNGVLGMADVLKSTDLTDKQQKLVDTIDRSGTALLTIINDILDFSKIEAGQMEFECKPFDIRKAVLEVRQLLNTDAVEKGLDLRVQIGKDVPVIVNGDDGRYRQILINLVGNALKFTHEGYVLIKLETENHDGTAHLKTSVIDTGIGIPLDKAAIIFDKFAQIDTSSTRKYGGTGLGLAISSNLARGMGGELRLDTNGGQGSIFWFALDMPIIKQGSNFSDRPLSEMIRLPILVVSADTDCLAKIKQNVQDWSGKAVCVKSETNAIDILKFMSNKKATFPLIIVDGTLPGKVAASIVNHIRNDPLMRSIPILVLIGPSADADLAGADKIISKTFTPDELKRDVYALITEGQTRQLIELETGKPNDKTSGPSSQDNQSSFDQIRSTAA